MVLLDLVLAQTLLALPLSAVPPQDPAPDPAHLLRYEPPAADARTTFSFTEKSTLAVDRLRSTMGADVFERQAPDRAVKQVVRRVWADATLAGEDGLKLQRTFLELNASMEVSNLREGPARPDGAAAAGSLLLGRTVEFAQAASGEVVRLSDDGAENVRSKGIEPELDALARDTSLQGLLPPAGQAVRVGEPWSIAAGDMLAALAPGGDLVTYYGPIQNQRDPDVVARFGGHAVSRFGSGEVTGEVEAELLGTELRDDLRLARVAVRFEVEVKRDPAPWMRVQSATFEMAKIGQTAKNASHSMTVAGEGVLLWDLERHRFVEFTASAKTTSDQRLDYAFDYMGTRFAGDEHFELSGTTTLELTAEYGDE